MKNKPFFWNKKNNFFSFILLPFALVYLLVIKINKALASSINFKNIKIICVGNIYLGGTGKTPLVKKIYDEIKKDKKCCVLKKYNKNQMDEINFLNYYTDLLIPKSRLEGLKIAINKGYEFVILDDGMQDHSFKKNISILCIKSKDGFGNEYILPAGPLRERLDSIKNYNLALINGNVREDLEGLIKKYNPNIKIFYSKYTVSNQLKNSNKNYFAFSGIGDNESFFETLIENGIKVYQTKEFEDHHNFSDDDILNLINLSEKKNLYLITTEKNYFNINKKFQNKIEYAKVDLEINELNKFINEIN
jgi:tetraacyldisaccharide 4'-kinase